MEAGLPLDSVLGSWGQVSLESNEGESVNATRRSKEEMRLGRLTEYRKKDGGISSVLAYDDLTGMKLDAGKVKEARSKEVGYIRDKKGVRQNTSSPGREEQMESGAGEVDRYQ